MASSVIKQSTKHLVNMTYDNGYVRVNGLTTGMAIGVNPESNRLFVMLPNGTTKYYVLTPMTN